MSRMVKKQKPIAQKKGKARVYTRRKPGAKPGGIENVAGTPETTGIVSQQESASLPSDSSPVPEKEGDFGGKQAKIEWSESSAGLETLPGPPGEEETAVLPAQIDEKIELLGFLMNQEEYAIPVSQVKEIIRPAEITVIPGSSPILLGIISLRGVIIPVFTLSNKLAQLNPSEESKTVQEEHERSKRIIIIQIDQGFFGLMVEGVTDVIKIKEETIQAPPSLLNQMGQEMIKGITRFKNRLIILLFIARIVDVIQDEIKKIRKT